MSDEIRRPAGAILTPLNMSDHFGITTEQAKSIQDSIMNNRGAINNQLPH